MSDNLGRVGRRIEQRRAGLPREDFVLLHCRLRPELHRLLDQLRSGDTLVVWKLDRLSRSLKDLLIILERIDTAGARFRSLTEAIDTSGRVSSEGWHVQQEKGLPGQKSEPP